MMRKSYRQLPFENKKPPRGKLLCSESELRVNPPSLGGMTPGQLRDICQGLAENECVQKLDLDGNQFALGFDGEDALQPLVDLVAVNKTLRTLDISNNGLYFREEEGLRGSLEKLVCNSNLTSIVIGGNMDIDDELMQKLGEWIAASGRRWRNISVGSVDSDFDDAVTRLKAGVRAATAAVESKAIAGYFSRPRAVEAPAKASAEPDVPRHQIGRAVSPVRGDHDDNVRQRDRSQSPGPVDDEKTVNSEVVPTETVASGAVLPSETPTAASSMPPGASPTRCQLFLEAFHAIRGDDESINKQDALEQIASERPDENFGVAEMECYLQFMMDNNFIMLSAAEDTIYIV